MSIHRFFRRRFPLRSRTRGIAFLCFILLMYGCGGEESVDKPIVESVGDEKPINEVPISTIYYPMIVGNRWVYRNPDGSEWSRQVDELEVFDGERYHSFNYNPPVELESIESTEYFTYADRFVRPIPIKGLKDVIWKIILDSGGETPEWGFGLHCSIDPDVPRVCHLDKASRIFNPPGILSMLFKTNPHVASLGELTLLRFPILPNQSFTALELRLRSKSDILGIQWEFYADTTIVAAIGNAPELVETPAGTFQDCLKILYEAGPVSIHTLQFVDISALGNLGPPGRAELEAFELTLHDELTDVLNYLVPKLGLQTVWLAPGVGPVKIETPNGIAELIDYEIEAVTSTRWRK